MSTPHIRYDDAIRPVASNGGGVFPLRSRQNTGVGSLRQPSVTRAKSVDDDLEDDGYDERDVKKAQVFGGWKLAFLAYQSVGVIYGDIGTSPLYVYSSTFSGDPSYDDLLGVLSLIIWTLTLIVSVKYVLIVLRADDEGEGGTFAVFSLVSRYANIVRRDPREERTVEMKRITSSELGLGARGARNFIERSRIAQRLLKFIGIFGVALIMSDGVLTPAQSVLGAIQGIEVVSPDISNSTIIGASCGILVVLFLVQPFGTTKLASCFAPIVIVWLLFNFVFGIYNLAVYDASVLKAFSPYFAGAYLVRNGSDGWKSLGGVLLAFTGVEALFADLGAFTRRAVQLSWLGFAFPCLLLGYIGQAAYISRIPSAWSNPFFNTVPPGCFWPSLVIAILAAIVASQAMITAVFQLLSQIMKLSYFPQIKVIHTSKIYYGQLYIPSANWLLMVGTVVVTAVYNNTTSLGHAYGTCVILVTFITTNMIGLVALLVWRIPTYIVVPVWFIFAALDGVYLSSALTKVPDGAWFTLALAVVLSTMFILWRFGKEQQWHTEASDRFPPSHMLVADDTTDATFGRGLRLSPAFGGAPITRINGIGIFFDKSGIPATTPTVFVHFLQKFHAASEVVIFFNLRPLETPTVPPEERFTITRCYIGSNDDSDSGMTRAPMKNCYRIVIRHGYNDQIVTDDLGMLLFEKLRDFVIREGVNASISERKVIIDGDIEEKYDSSGDLAEAKRQAFMSEAKTGRASFEQREVYKRLADLQKAFDSQVVYVVGKEQLRLKKSMTLREWPRRIILSGFLWVRDNTRTKVQALNIAVDKLVEVGFVKEL